MMQLGFLALLTLSVLLLHVDANADQEVVDEIRNKFRAFKVNFNKVYKDAIEENARYTTFQENDKLAALRNLQESTEVHGVTKFSDLTPVEFSELLLARFPKDGLLFPEDTIVEPAANKELKDTSALVDWSGIYATNIKDQGSCSSCSAFAALESDSLRVLKFSYDSDKINLSPQQVVSCSKHNSGCGSGGGSIDTAFNYVLSAGGLAYDAYYPYKSDESGQTGTCVEFDGEKFTPAVTLSAVNAISGETTAVANYVSSTSPVTVYIDATALQTYKGGVITAASCPADGSYVNHAAQIVGVLPNFSDGYWKLRNQWGSDWGEDGFARISFGSNTCNAFQFFSYYTTPQQLPSHWLLKIETAFLVFRYLNPTADKRIAFHPGVYKDFGTVRQYPNEATVRIYKSSKWEINEERGVLTVRDISTTGDYRYAFFPDNAANFGTATDDVGEFGFQVLFTGYRWSISIDNGVLVFRDNLSSGESRFMFHQSCIDMYKA